MSAEAAVMTDSCTDCESFEGRSKVGVTTIEILLSAIVMGTTSPGSNGVDVFTGRRNWLSASGKMRTSMSPRSAVSELGRKESSERLHKTHWRLSEGDTHSTERRVTELCTATRIKGTEIGTCSEGLSGRGKTGLSRI